MTNKDLIEKAYKAKENSYSPYSKFQVGAALETDDGQVYTGCNIENAAYSVTNCAERTALFKAVSEGKRKFTKIAIVSSSDDHTYPCGVCRQALWEFSQDMKVVTYNKEKDEIKEIGLRELLTHGFTL